MEFVYKWIHYLCLAIIYICLKLYSFIHPRLVRQRAILVICSFRPLVAQRKCAGFLMISVILGRCLSLVFINPSNMFSIFLFSFLLHISIFLVCCLFLPESGDATTYQKVVSLPILYIGKSCFRSYCINLNINLIHFIQYSCLQCSSFVLCQHIFVFCKVWHMVLTEWNGMINYLECQE